MSEFRPTVLVPVDVSTEERPDSGLLELLAPARIVLLGWYPVPDQTAPQQLQAEHEAAAVDRIEALAAEVGDDAADVETVVVFTHDRSTTVDRLADEHDCDVVVVPDDVHVVERLLVPVRGDVNVDRIVRVVGALLDESDVSVTLFHAASDDETDAEFVLEDVATALVAVGVDEERIDTVSVRTDSPVDEILDAGANHDVVVIGETEPSLVEQILGDVPTKLIEESGRPVLVVRKVD